MSESHEQWCVIGVWLASRDFPTLPFFLPLVDATTGDNLELEVPYKMMLASFSPKYNDHDRILLHTRVAQRRDNAGKLFGEVRYICTDLENSYGAEKKTFDWSKHQSVHTLRAKAIVFPFLE